MPHEPGHTYADMLRTRRADPGFQFNEPRSLLDPSMIAGGQERKYKLHLIYPQKEANEKPGELYPKNTGNYAWTGDWVLKQKERDLLETRVRRALAESGVEVLPDMEVHTSNKRADAFRTNWGPPTHELGIGNYQYPDDIVPVYLIRGLGAYAGGSPGANFQNSYYVIGDGVIESLAGFDGKTAFDIIKLSETPQGWPEEAWKQWVSDNSTYQAQMGTVLHEAFHAVAALPHNEEEMIHDYSSNYGGAHGEEFARAIDDSLRSEAGTDRFAALNLIMNEMGSYSWGSVPGSGSGYEKQTFNPGTGDPIVDPGLRMGSPRGQAQQETTMAGENEIPLEAFSADNVDAQGTALAGSRDPDANPNDIKANFLNTYMGISTGVKVPTDLRAAFDESAGTWRIWIKPGIREGEFESPSEAEAQATKETERTGVVHTVKRSTTTGGYQVVEVEPSTQRGYATEELALAQAQPDQEAYELGGNQGWALRRKFEPDQKIDPKQPFFLHPETEEAHFIDLGGGKKMFFLTDGSTVTAQGAVDWTNATVQTVAEGTAQEQKFVVWPDGTKSPLGDKFTGGVPPAEIALQSQIMLADGTFAAVLNNGQVFRTGREIKPAEVKPDPITGKIQVTQPDGSISFIDPAYPVQLDQVGGYNLLQQRSGAVADIGLPEVPASIEEMQGQQFIRGTRGELVPLNDVLDRTIEMALINGDVDKAIAFDDFRKRPSRAEALQMALEFARSPADQVLISAISSGETHIAPPSPGELQRVGPQAQFLQQAYQEFRDTLTGGRLPTTAEFQEAMAPPPPPPPTDMEIAQLEHQQLVNQQLTQKIEFDKGKAQREIDAFNLRMSQDAAKHIAEMTKINKEEEIAVREANQKISESLANTDVTQYSGEQITMPAPIPPAPMPDEDEDEEWSAQVMAEHSKQLMEDRIAEGASYGLTEAESRSIAEGARGGVSFQQAAARSLQEELEGMEGTRESLQHIALGSGSVGGQLQNLASFRETLREDPEAQIAQAGSGSTLEDQNIRYRAGGGRVGNKEVTVVGEQGPEIAMFPVGTEIIPMGQPTAGQMDMARRTGRAYANGGEIGGIVFDRYGGEIPSGARRTMAGQPIAPSAGRVFTAAGLGVPSGQSLRNMLPEDLDVYRDLGAQAGIPEGTFERELMLGTPSGERQRGSARFLPLSLRS